MGEFDIKTFIELRPGMILWFLIDLAMVCKQYVDLGTREFASWMCILARL